MTIVYPRALPSSRVLGVTFELDPQQAFAPEHGGRFVSQRLGRPLWKMALDTTPPSEAEFDLWRAWVTSLDGAGLLFYGRDVRRGPYPRLYREGFADLTRAVSDGGFDGSSTAWSVNAGRDEITIGAASGQELPFAFRLTHGDYFDFRWDTSSRSLHRILEDANADGSGVGTWTVRPRIPSWVPGGSTINFVAPECTMAIEKFSLEGGHFERRVSFEAVEHLPR